MMNLKKLSLLLFCSFLVAITACKKDDAPKSPKETAIEKLSKAWKVNVDGTSAEIGTAATYSDIVLTFNSNGTYSMTGADDLEHSGNKPAPNASGNWVINEEGTEITFDGTKTVDVSTLTDTNLIFSFTGKEAPKFSTDVTIEYNMVP